MTTGTAPEDAAPPVVYPSTTGAENPYPYYKWAQAHCPVHHLQSVPSDDPSAPIPGGPLPGTEQMYFVSRYEDIRYITGHPELFSSEGRSIGTAPRLDPPLTAAGVPINSMIGSDPPDANVHRRFALAPFKPSALRRHAAMVEAHVTDLIDAFIEKGSCDFIRDFATPLPTYVICDIMGFPYSLREDVQKWNQIEASGMLFMPLERRRRQLEIAQQLQDYVTGSLEDRRTDLKDDALSSFIKAQIERDGELSLEYVRAQANILIAGGVITTAHMLGMTLLLLLQHPEQMRKVRADEALIRPMIEEALRSESPVQWVPRRTTQETELGGVAIPAGSWVLLGWGAANRDTSRWSNPDAFDIERVGAEQHLAFGHGIHFCLGAPLARLEGRVAFERLFSRLGEIRLSADNDLAHFDSPSFRGLRKLNIEFEPASSPCRRL